MSQLLEIALSQYGVKEIAGDQHNKTIIDYAKEAGFDWVNDDETPWCSIWMNWVAMKAGLERTQKANARSWLEVGDPVTKPETGDIVIFKRGSDPKQGHVGIYINQLATEDGYTDFINVLGGNQGNQVKISLYSKLNVLGFRRLNKIK